MTIRPGDNNFPLNAIINQVEVALARDKTGVVTLSIAGTSAVYNGQHLQYYVSPN